MAGQGRAGQVGGEAVTKGFLTHTHALPLAGIWEQGRAWERQLWQHRHPPLSPLPPKALPSRAHLACLISIFSGLAGVSFSATCPHPDCLYWFAFSHLECPNLSLSVSQSHHPLRSSANQSFPRPSSPCSHCRGGFPRFQPAHLALGCLCAIVFCPQETARPWKAECLTSPQPLHHA